MYNPYNQFPPMPQMQPPQMDIPKVNGEDSARAFPIGPNSSVILLDTTNPIIWVVATDASGFKTITPYTITPYTPEKPIDPSDLKTQLSAIDDRLSKLEERMNNRGQSNHRHAWKNKSGNERDSSNDSNGEVGE